MHIKYEVRAEDIKTLAEFHYAKSATVRRMRRWLRGVIIATIVLAVLFFLIFEKPSTALIVGAVLILWLWFSLWHHRRSYVKNVVKMFSEGSGKGIFGPAEMAIDDEGLHVASSTSKSTLHWDAVESIETSGDHSLVYISAVSAFVIPRETVNEGDYDAFVAELRKRSKQAG